MLCNWEGFPDVMHVINVGKHINSPFVLIDLHLFYMSIIIGSLQVLILKIRIDGDNRLLHGFHNHVIFPNLTYSSIMHQYISHIQAIVMHF